jgi:branched-chain amino acid transport system permease protein
MGAALVTIIGLGLFEVARRQFVAQWGAVQEDIEAEIRRRDAL